MSSVEFEEDQFRPMNKGSASERQSVQSFGASGQDLSHQPAMIRFLMKHHLASSPRTAQAVLLGVVLIDFIAAYIVVTHYLQF